MYVNRNEWRRTAGVGASVPEELLEMIEAGNDRAASTRAVWKRLTEMVAPEGVLWCLEQLGGRTDDPATRAACVELTRLFSGALVAETDSSEEVVAPSGALVAEIDASSADFTSGAVAEG